jgi:uncharacterized protein with NRDE domain
MCTLVTAFRVVEGWPLVVAANRDERLDRPSSGLRVSTSKARRILAPRDEVKGGTWLGVNDQGLFVGITNRFGAGLDDSRDSRGLLVQEALEEPSAPALRERLSSLPPERFNAFHLYYADAQAAFFLWSDASVLHHEVLSPGVHVVTESSFGADPDARDAQVRSEYSALLSQGGASLVARLEQFLRQHGDNPRASVCVHAPEWNYGTRSSTILLMSDRVARSRLFWGEGHPCESSYVERTGLLTELSLG